MSDADIQVGDIVIDLTQNAKMVVLERAADTVEEYNERNDFDLASYKVHPQLRVTEDEPVFTCCYLKGELASPGGTYSFPESRLARIPVEQANEDAVRPQETIRVDVVRAVLERYDASENDSQAALEDAIVGALGEELASLVFELHRAETFGTEVDADDD